MNALRVGIVRETASGERRVALIPESIGRLAGSGWEILAERDAGAAAWFPDSQYVEAGARIVGRATLFAEADVIVCVHAVGAENLRAGQLLVGLLGPLLDPTLMADLAQRQVTAVSLDGLPRTLSRAQGMDAMTSQSNAAGYQAVLVAAQHFDRFFPLLITAAGTFKPATVLVLGAGVAGLQAIGTARRLGAIVSGYDVRPAASSEVASLGAKFIELQSVAALAGEGGYAPVLSEEQQQAQQAELEGHIVRHDIVITTAQIPGRRPPLMVRASAVAAMKPGSVIIDMGASDLGGNVEGSEPEQTIVTPNGVTLIGAPNLASAMATSSSAAYSRNIAAVLRHLIPEGTPVIDLDDEVQRGIVITHGGQVVQPATLARLDSIEGAQR